MKRLIGTLITFGLALLILPILVSADDFIPPDPFYIISGDGTKVFHVTPHLREDLITWGEDEFPETGLYYNTDPPIPIYLVTSPFVGCHFGYLWEQDFFFSRDMQYFAWSPTTNTKGTAVVFFANGIAQKTYNISDLINDLDAVAETTTTLRWIYGWRNENISFDAETNLLTIKTIESQTYVFDITSGEIVEAPSPPSQFSWLQLAVLIVIGSIVLIGGIIFLCVKRKSIFT